MRGKTLLNRIKRILLFLLLLKLKNASSFFNYAEKRCNALDFEHKYYTKSYMINTNTFQTGVTLPLQVQNKLVTKTNTKKSNIFCC